MTGPTDLDDVDLARRVLAAAPTVGPVRLVCIDGPSGAGKTTLATTLAAELADVVGVVPVVHGDEVYEGWDVVAGAADPVEAFATLAARLDRWLLDPWSRGLEGAHPVWDWATGRWGAARTVPAASVVVLEGVGLGAAPLRARACLTVWVDADPLLRARRVSERDGAEVDAHMQAWRAREAAWHSADSTRAGADISVRTG